MRGISADYRAAFSSGGKSGGKPGGNRVVIGW